ncbi:tlde1 domain-containing protein [Rhizobium sp. YIM 134829]|uniref:DUF2778 domain-containing protein n=1 Tax=Rhizobium sp. YIM 134829 TaxID=3390453 RepID=UPI00397A3BBB
MALAVETTSSLPSGQRRRQGSFLSKSVVLTGGFAASLLLGGWMVVTLATMHGMGGAVAENGLPRFETSLQLNAIPRATRTERVVHLAKFSRLVKTPLMAVADAGAPRQMAARASATGVTLVRPAITLAAATPVQPLPPMPGLPTITTSKVTLPATVTAGLAARDTGGVTVPLRENAMVEPDARSTGALPKPFSLVLSNDDTAERLPDLGPLPMTRPGVTIEPEAEAEVAPPAAVKDKPAKRTLLAYAKPDVSMDDDEDDAPVSRPLFGGRKGVAIYDISAGVVHMPNGEKLEAHSGIGAMRDNPDYVHVPMKGPTPPGTYKVTMRESLFHGVEAVRLTPVDGVAPHGRVGLLAHSYLLRKRGDSHGCVAFANYPKFLSAFKRGEIKQMVIVKSMKGGFSKPAKTLASLFSRKG